MAGQVAQVQEGLATGGLTRVDPSLIPQSQVGTDVYQNVRILRTAQDYIRGDSGGRKMVFAPPNSGLLNMREINIVGNFTLDGTGRNGGQFPFNPSDGSVWKWDGSGDDPSLAMLPDDVNNLVYTTNIIPGLSDPFFFSSIERIVVTVGGTPIQDIRDLNVINHMALKMQWNSNFLATKTATYQGYDAHNGNRIPGSPGTGYWEYPERMIRKPETRFFNCTSVPQPFQIRPFMYDNALFNKTDGVLPLQFMPNVTIEVYFAASEDILKQALPPGYRFYQDLTKTVGRVNYIIENLRMEILMAGSNSLEKALVGQGMSMTYKDYAHHTRQETVMQGIKSYQIPVTQRAVEEVFILIRPQNSMKSMTASGKLSAYWSKSREIQSLNIRINGIRRYGEDLDSRGCYTEFRRLEPMIAGSELFMDEKRDWNKQNQILVLSSKMDYDKQRLSGIKTASQTSPLIVDLKFSPDNRDLNSEGLVLQMDFFVLYTRWLSVTREQIEVID
jgi:hypothetical protein